MLKRHNFNHIIIIALLTILLLAACGSADSGSNLVDTDEAGRSFGLAPPARFISVYLATMTLLLSDK